ncbi:hypothetical protein V8C86DRAFT_2868775, partial [Haematococcus lacustris]
APGSAASIREQPADLVVFLGFTVLLSCGVAAAGQHGPSIATSSLITLLSLLPECICLHPAPACWSGPALVHSKPDNRRVFQLDCCEWCQL